MKPYKPTGTARVTNIIVRGISSILLKVDAQELVKVPDKGPLIIVTNHVNFLEAPTVYTRLTPRPVTGYAKIESWDSSLLGWLFDVWEIIPINRGEADKSAVKSGLQVLKDGYILTIAPEGTRSRDGNLLRGKPGVVLLALLSNAPLLPLAHYGHQDYRQDFRNLRRAPFKVVVGNPFSIKKGEEKVTGAIRQKIVDEIMYQLASLLPPEHRGEYSDFSKATEKYLQFTTPSKSNLPS